MQYPEKYNLSQKIDQRSVFDYIIEKGESALGEVQALCLEFLPEDEAYIPTPAEIYESYRHMALDLCHRLKSAVNDDSFALLATTPVTRKNASLTDIIAQNAFTLDEAIFTIGELENDGLCAEGMKPLSIASERTLQDLISTITPNRSQQKLASITEDVVYADPPVFAHRATNMYYLVASDLLALAKPLSKESDEQLAGFAGRLFVSFLPTRTRKWIDDLRVKMGYQGLNV